MMQYEGPPDSKSLEQRGTRTLIDRRFVVLLFVVSEVSNFNICGIQAINLDQVALRPGRDRDDLRRELGIQPGHHMQPRAAASHQRRYPSRNSIQDGSDHGCKRRRHAVLSSWQEYKVGTNAC